MVSDSSSPSKSEEVLEPEEAPTTTTTLPNPDCQFQAIPASDSGEEVDERWNRLASLGEHNCSGLPTLTPEFVIGSSEGLAAFGSNSATEVTSENGVLTELFVSLSSTAQSTSAIGSFADFPFGDARISWSGECDEPRLERHCRRGIERRVVCQSRMLLVVHLSLIHI